MRQWAITIGDKKIDNEQYVGLHPEKCNEQRNTDSKPRT